MHQVLREILDSQIVYDGDSPLPLHDNMAEEDCRLITGAIRAVRPRTSLEVGFGCGVSTLFVCDALTQNGTPSKHIVIDPHQSTIFRSIGTQNILRAGYQHLIELHEVASELALPKLLAAGTRIQTAIIDGWHTFDHTLVDFFYVNKMLEVGGIVLFDDANFPSILRLTEHIKTYPAYEPFPDVVSRSAVRIRTRIRRAMAHRLPSLRRSWDYPRCLAFRKVMPDTRNWDWHIEF
jgi:predicted O-methyltransferase YrrM